MTKEEVCCPYDSGFCAAKEIVARKQEQNSNVGRTQSGVNHVLYGHCPLSIQERARCERYRAYLDKQR